MTETIPPGYKQIGLAGGFEELIGPIYRCRDGDDVRFAFRAEKRHANPNDVIHGGMLTTLLDHALGAHVWHAIDRKPCATVSLNVSFISAGRPGDWIESTGRVTRRGRTLVFAEGELTTGDRTLITAKGVWKILNAG